MEGSRNHDAEMVQGMSESTQGEVHGGRMKGFAQAFTEAMERACPGLSGEAGLEEPGKAPC